MDELDEILESREVDLDFAEEDFVSPLPTSHRRESQKFAESVLRNEVMGPQIVYFTPTYTSNQQRKRGVRIFVLLFAVVLSLYGVFNFRKILSPLSHEATLDIETKMVVTDNARDVNATTHNNHTTMSKNSSP